MFGALGHPLYDAAPISVRTNLASMRTFLCSCGNNLYFGNSSCLLCGSTVGFEPTSREMIRLNPDGEFRLCRNGVDYAACNWLVRDGQEYCPSCSLNRTVPDLSLEENLVAWRKIEAAKRRVLFTLLELGFDLISKKDNPEAGLAFDILRPTPTQNVLTGHENGVITLNLDEANDAERERRREVLGEADRTLAGHLRHESAHYYWDRFFAGRLDDDQCLRAYRELFGDERADYQAALQRHYANGPRPDWAADCITAYASSHPWEDWAETWTHYLHITDAMETASVFGLHDVTTPAAHFPEETIELPCGLSLRRMEAARFLAVIENWTQISPALNELAESLGHSTLYPYALSAPVVRKLNFIHFMVQTRSERRSDIFHAVPTQKVTAGSPTPGPVATGTSQEPAGHRAEASFAA